MMIKQFVTCSLLLTSSCSKLPSIHIFKQCKSTVEYVKPHKRKGVVERSRHFVDYMKVTVKGGNGGNGMMSLSSLPNLEWAGPDGGNGGNGGHVILQATHNVTSLSHLRPFIAAPGGIKGKTQQRDGKNAQHFYIKVPLGTVIKCEDGRLLASLDAEEDIFIAARGGAGGRGNYSYLSNENRAPLMAEKGGQGQERDLHVELKTMAHAGFIGFPNAGKSSFLRAISRAQPKVSPYPFTTLNPHIGMVLYTDHCQLAVADIPGLIPGSHMNRGMGHSFLRHIERCLCLVYVIDMSLDEPWLQLMQLRYELNQYMDGLADRPSLLVANKIDIPGAPDRLEQLIKWMAANKVKSGKVEVMCSDTSDNNYSNSSSKTKLSNTNSSDIDIQYNSAINNISSRLTGNRNEQTSFVCSSNTNLTNEEFSIDSVVMNERDSNISNSNKNLNSDAAKIEVKIEVQNLQTIADPGCVRVSSFGNDSESCDRKEDIVVLGVSSKYEIGIPSFLHHLRVIYDSHNLSPLTAPQTASGDDEIR